MTRPAGLAVGIAIAAACVTIGSALLPWITAGVGTQAATYRGTELPPAALPVSVAALLTVVLALGSRWKSPGLASYAVVASGVGAVFATATIVVTETVSLMIPTGLLPDTLSRATLALGAGFGLWLALAGLAVAGVAMHGRLSGSLARQLRISSDVRGRLAALVCLGAVTVLIGWLRYRTWIDASLLDRHLNMPAWVAPWIGPLSLLSVWMLAGALLLAAFYSDSIGGLVAAAAGWLTSAVAALVIIAVGSIGRLGLENLTPAPANAAFHVTEFVWIAFIAGLATAGIGAFLVQLPTRSESSEPWRS